MKTLIIHPFDPSTSFLEIVYESIENKTVIIGGVSKDDIRKQIKEHDRVMMMGHGSPSGLFSVGQFFENRNYCSYIIDETMVPLLSEKDNSVFIWCNADRFVNKFELKGFYSGMFISEVGEANYCGLQSTSQDVVDESNYGFVNIIAKHINENTEIIYNNVRNEYGVIAKNNPVALYNNLRLYKK
jgi:hypothetical protein